MSMRDDRATSPPVGPVSRRWAALFLGMVAVGGAAFATALSGPDPARAWQAYLVNVLFWTGLASGAVLLSAVLTLSEGRWGDAVKPLAEAFGAFLPVCVALFGGLWFGRALVFPDLAEALPARRLWLSPGFLFLRDGAALLALAAAGLALVRGSARERGHPVRGQGVATLFAVLYAVVLTLVAFDWIMSLDPHWNSTLFGAYYFIGSFYTGLAAVAVVRGMVGAGTGTDVGSAASQDLGTLLLGFGFATGYLFYVQFLVIWYGNLPAETRFLILRLRAAPWAHLTWVVLAAGFAVPTTVLLFRRAKARPAVVGAVGGLILAALWLERFVLVAPSLSRGGALPLGLSEALITAGFAGLAALSVAGSLRRLPPPSPTAPAASPGRLQPAPGQVSHGRR
ncbi:MAG: polysulfide reductase NrfD [Deltaproteobacteria bacterium]|nr:polysulfide reductase NrfD [Deltaproteobacteria bacterium]